MEAKNFSTVKFDVLFVADWVDTILKQEKDETQVHQTRASVQEDWKNSLPSSKNNLTLANTSGGAAE